MVVAEKGHIMIPHSVDLNFSKLHNGQRKYSVLTRSKLPFFFFCDNIPTL